MLSVAAAHAERVAPRFWGNLVAGAHHVGFRRETSSELIIDVWYPAEYVQGAPLTFGDYIRLSDDLRGAETARSNSPDAVRRTIATAMTGDPEGIAPAMLTVVTAAPMAAHRDAPSARARFPLVIWTPRYGTTAAQAVLSEYLASRGYVVAFARSRARSARLPFELPSPEARAEELAINVEDMRSTVRFLDGRREVDASAIGVLAWSYTGEMATAFQLIEPRVRLVAGLSTTLINDWVFQPPEAIASLDTSRMHAVYAVFTQQSDASGFPPPIMRALRQAYFIALPGLAHGSFNALEGFIPSLLAIPRVQPWSRSGPEGVRGYEATATILLRLLRHHLRPTAAPSLSRIALMTGIPPDVAVLDPLR